MKRKFKSLLAISLTIVSSSMYVSCENEGDFQKEETHLSDEIVSAPKEVLMINGQKIHVKKTATEGKYLVENDILMDISQMEQYYKPDAHKANIGQIQWRNIWPNKTVYYQINPRLRHRGIINNAMQIITQQTGIRFVNSTGTGNYIDITSNIYGEDSSDIGMAGGRQELSLSSASLGIAIHEFGHALGLAHEHSRSDRDQYLVVDDKFWDKPFYGYSYGAFDFNSIMLYGSIKLSNGNWSFVRRSDRQPFRSAMDSRSPRFSHGDLAVLRALYR